MIELEYMPQMIEDRHAFLRSLAARPPVPSERGSIRQRVGRTVIWIGGWIEGRRSQIVVTHDVTTSRRATSS